MRFLVSQPLLVFISVLSLTRTQSTSAPITLSTEGITTTPEPNTTTLPETTTETTSVTPETTTTPAPTTTLTETTILATTSFTAESTTAVPSPPLPPPTTTTLETTTETTSVTPETTTTTAPTTTLKETTTVSTTAATTTPWTAPAIFYPFGAKAGDIKILENGGDTYYHVVFSTPFTYFGRTYNSIYVNNNGLLTFNHSLPETNPYPFPAYGAVDYIAPLLTDLDDLGIGKYSYQEYTSGSVLTRATQDINQYFPGRDFTASWVFVATWDYVLTWDMNVFNQHSGPAITVQAVLISDGGFSYIQIHYGDCAGIPDAVGAGYDTKGSTDYYQIHYDPYGGYSIPNLKNTTNVGVPGRWAFLVNNGSETVIGVQMKLQSFSNLTQRENSDAVLQIIKQELIKYGVSSKFELKLRKLQKINP
ncbi:sushi, nidogen and EGF-like domain-containing protein 1 [Cyprinus carpio]|uniref:Sushi, nidogen and EGF-like domain-containing protein 1 n=1 Tax=Cyprinus carpio TaxID=7962 RepID=A0A9R0B672_CYPCA|nr:sushi, nidogen and EGF-like domain-containing protein 1 [Cyprinus carpio]